MQTSKAYLIPYPVESFSKPITIASHKTYIGTDSDGGIQITQDAISSSLAVIRFEDGHYVLEGLGCPDGLYLNAERIQKAELKSHDKITMGDRTLLFLLKTENLGDPLPNPFFPSEDTLAADSEEIDLSGLWAQNTEYAARSFIHPKVEDSSPDTLDPYRLAHLRLSMLYRLSENLRPLHDTEQIYGKALDLLMEAMPAAECVLIVTKSEFDGSFQVAAFRLRHKPSADGDAIPISRTLFDWVFSEKVTLFSRNASEDLRFEESDSIRIQNLRSITCVPIIGEDRVIGLLYAQSSSFVDPITKEDALFTSAVANELAMTLDNHRLQAEALRNERMAAIGLTVGNLAHNIKNMLALTQNAAQLLEGQIAKLGISVEKYWQWLQQGLSGINRLSIDILEYVKEDRLRLTPIDVNRSILKYRNSLESSLSRTKIALDFALSEQNPVWMLDEVQFQRALLNLVLNAADAVQQRKKKQVRIITSVNKQNFLVVGVVDNGSGISPQKINRVLDLFFTTKGTRGTGLGLPMVQKFVEKSGGKLEINSKEGVGSIFKMLFPNRNKTDRSISN